MPVYNTETYLKDCLDSVCLQPFRDFELICVDDESTDGSLALLRSYERLDPRVRVIAMPHGGQSAARNLGMREARGKYVYFMDSDDMLADGALGRMCELMEERAVDILCFDGETFFDTPELKETYARFKQNYRRGASYRDVVSGVQMFTCMSSDNAYWVIPCLQVFRRDYLRAIGLKFFEGIIYEDNISTLESMLQAGRVSHENAVLFHRRIRSQSTVTAPRAYRNFFGYFICWVMMVSFAKSRKYPPETRRELDRRVNFALRHAIECSEAVPVREIRENMRREHPLLRMVYFSAFHMPVVRRASKRTGEKESATVAYRVLRRAGRLVSVLAARAYGAGKRAGRL
jgi:glycosyltransferase involved in cell wall biosynthesis